MLTHARNLSVVMPGPIPRYGTPTAQRADYFIDVYELGAKLHKADKTAGCALQELARRRLWISPVTRKEIVNEGGDLFAMGFERNVAGVEE